LPPRRHLTYHALFDFSREHIHSFQNHAFIVRGLEQIEALGVVARHLSVRVNDEVGVGLFAARLDEHLTHYLSLRLEQISVIRVQLPHKYCG